MANPEWTEPEDWHGVAKIRAENERLWEALTPSAATRAAYAGKTVTSVSIVDHEGVVRTYVHEVSRQTVCEIMNMIADRAAPES